MNKKLIAAAVSAAVMVPVAAQAEPEFSFYGRVDSQLTIADDGDESTTDLGTNGSRIGINASSDLGNGLTAKGHYEWFTTSDNNGQAFSSTRLGYVALEGSFGEFSAGQQYSAYYDAVGTHIEPFYSASPVNITGGAVGASRTGRTLQWHNSFGPVAVSIDVRADDGSDGEHDAQGSGAGIGISFNPVDSITVGLGWDTMDGLENQTAQSATERGNDDPDVSTFGVAIKGTWGGHSVVIGNQTKEVDSVDESCFEVATPATCIDADDVVYAEIDEIETDVSQILYSAAISDYSTFIIGYGVEEEDDGSADDIETDSFSIGIDYAPGGGLVFWAEYNEETSENPGHDAMAEDEETDQIVLGMRLIF